MMQQPYPTSLREKDSQFRHPGAPQPMYLSMSNASIPGSWPPPQQPNDQQFRHRQDSMLSNRPLFRTNSDSSLAPPTQHPVQGNILGRKTPSGILSAYDTSSAEFMGRPSKQILSPASGLNHIHLDSRISWREGAINSLIDGNNDGEARWSSQPNSPFEDDLDPIVRHFLVQQQQQNQHMAGNFQASPWTNGQPSGFQPMYNPITAPTASCDEINGYIMDGSYSFAPRDSGWNLQQGEFWTSPPSTPSVLVPQVGGNMDLNGQYGLEAQNMQRSIWANQPSGLDVGGVVEDTHTQLYPLYAQQPLHHGVPQLRRRLNMRFSLIFPCQLLMSSRLGKRLHYGPTRSTWIY